MTKWEGKACGKLGTYIFKNQLQKVTKVDVVTSTKQKEEILIKSRILLETNTLMSFGLYITICNYKTIIFQNCCHLSSNCFALCFFRVMKQLQVDKHVSSIASTIRFKEDYEIEFFLEQK